MIENIPAFLNLKAVLFANQLFAQCQARLEKLFIQHGVVSEMQRTSFVIHIIDSEHIRSDNVFETIFRAFPESYVNVIEFTQEQYLGIDEPESVE